MPVKGDNMKIASIVLPAKNRLSQIFFTIYYNFLYNILRMLHHRNGKNNIKVISRLEVSQLLKKNIHLSLCRFGDGELGIAFTQHTIGFQEYSHTLSVRLQEILKSPQMDNMLVCIPDVFNGLEEMRPASADFWKQWYVMFHSIIENNICKEYLYGDTNISRIYLPWRNRKYESQIVDNIRSVWTDKCLVICEGDKTRFGVGNTLINNAAIVKRIICPSENAWDKYELILKKCLDISSEDCVFVLALGPTATVLAWDLAKYGLRALDLGHLDLQFEYMVRTYSCKKLIPNKYNNEVAGGRIVSECDDKSYVNSIIARIS